MPSCLAHLKPMSGLRELSVEISDNYDDWLVNMRSLTGPRRLALHRGFTNAGLVHVDELTNLTELVLESSHINDVGLKHLRGLSNLQRLTLRNVNITDSGLKHLSGLTKLESLELTSLALTDSGLADLKDLTGLRSLSFGDDFNSNKVSDAGLTALKSLTRLQSLNLGSMAVHRHGPGPPARPDWTGELRFYSLKSDRRGARSSRGDERIANAKPGGGRPFPRRRPESSHAV